jgi:hypothetical protein
MPEAAILSCGIEYLTFGKRCPSGRESTKWSL